MRAAIAAAGLQPDDIDAVTPTALPPRRATSLDDDEAHFRTQIGNQEILSLVRDLMLTS